MLSWLPPTIQLVCAQGIKPVLAFALRKHNQEDKLLLGRGVDSHTPRAKAGNWLFPLVPSMVSVSGFASGEQLKLEVLVAFEGKDQS